jgi:hypothetical protein
MWRVVKFLERTGSMGECQKRNVLTVVPHFLWERGTSTLVEFLPVPGQSLKKKL